jgi:predicted transcriptional regulator
MVETTEGDVAILSIHPMYVDAIRTGNKRIEFRKTRFTKNVKFIIIYETAPSQKIVGFFSVKKIVSDTPKNLWNQFSTIGCIAKSDFLEYFKNSQIGYGIEIDKYQDLANKIDITELCDTPPQSFRYIDKTLFLSKVKNNSMSKKAHN